jgi:FAD:protein FMN transferase
MAAEARFPAMGSQAHVVVIGDEQLMTVARARIAELEARWSRFIPESEISRLNAEPGVALAVSEDTFRLVRRARDGWRRTGGRFDPTVLGDMIRAGYDRTFQAVVLRSNGGVSLLERNAGGIRLDPDARSVTLPLNAGFDPGGIGKGLAADIVVEELIAAGAEGACVNLGGDIRVEGTGPDRGPWIIDIDHPTRAKIVATIGLVSGGVATSTSAKRAWTVAGERRHHLIDPGTGVPADREAMAVTVLSRDAASAEIATKCALLAEPGLEVAALEELGCDGLIVTHDDDVRCTPGFERFVVKHGRA